LIFGGKGKYYAEELLSAIRNGTNRESTKEQKEDIIESSLALFNMGKGKLMQAPVVRDCRQALLTFVQAANSR